MGKMSSRLIGLTGGISTGKSTVANYLAQTYQLPILDADIYARDAVQLGSPILQAIAHRYNPNILLADGRLNRQQLGQIIFQQPEERRWLEQQIHPYVRDRLVEAITQLSPQYSSIVLVIPLLFEAGMTDLVTETWLVSCSESQQLARLIQRDSLTHEQALARINSQMPLVAKIAQADVVLDNSSTPEALQQQVDRAMLSDSRSHSG